MPARDRQARVGDLHCGAADLCLGHLFRQPLDRLVAEPRVLLPEELRGCRISRVPPGEQLRRLLVVIAKRRAIRQSVGRRDHFFGTSRRILPFGPSVSTYNAPSGPSLTPRMRAFSSVSKRCSPTTRPLASTRRTTARPASADTKRSPCHSGNR